MDREEAKKLLPIMQVFADGKKIETRYDIYDWTETEVLYLDGNNEYRIKPEPKYRPFKNQEECWNEMHKHSDFGWVVSKSTKTLYYVNAIYSDYTCIDVNETSLNYPEAFNNYTFADGEPFGIKE